MRATWLRRTTIGLLLAMAILIPLAEIADWKMTLLQNGILVAASLVALPETGRFGRWFVGVVLLASIGLIVAYGLPMAAVAKGLSSGGPVLAFLLMVEVLGAAIQTGKYDITLTAGLNRYAHTVGARRKAAGIGAFSLTMAGMFAAAVPAVYYAIDGRRGEAGLTNAISASRGFVAAVVLSPLSPLVVIALGASGANLLEYLVYAFPVALMLLALDWLPRRGDAEAPDAAVALPASLPRAQVRTHMVGLALGTLAFLGVYLALEPLAPSSLTHLGVSALGAAMALGAATGRSWFRSLLQVPAARFTRHTATVPVFVLGGLFGNLIVESGLLTPLVQLVKVANMPWLEAPLIVLLMVLFRWMGVVPAIALFILVPIFSSAVSLSPALYTVAMVFGTNAAVLISPISITTIFIAGATGISPFEICLKRQRWYVLSAVVLFSLYAAVLLG